MAMIKSPKNSTGSVSLGRYSSAHRATQGANKKLKSFAALTGTRQKRRAP